MNKQISCQKDKKKEFKLNICQNGLKTASKKILEKKFFYQKKRLYLPLKPKIINHGYQLNH